ncbi:hypothetical protein [Noviherbaspirillum pedocola]|uniref:Uncharacterized protein n=1 Tax=Noviherbaspirillum pedocola TaxID=2801341 RepID=A0A934SY42_9BURK|nr:hypothetical protein [Noviherbaspirillum pedocola]MBK4737688.1 hypothetical protein [Noviherbaspirillum pedocola]
MIQQIQHETVFFLFAIVLALAGAVALAVATDSVHGARQLEDEYAGFNALVVQLLGNVCPVASVQK